LISFYYTGQTLVGIATSQRTLIAMTFWREGWQCMQLLRGNTSNNRKYILLLSMCQEEGANNSEYFVIRFAIMKKVILE
jgi:hypothetical protein